MGAPLPHVGGPPGGWPGAPGQPWGALPPGPSLPPGSFLPPGPVLPPGPTPGRSARMWALVALALIAALAVGAAAALWLTRGHGEQSPDASSGPAGSASSSADVPTPPAAQPTAQPAPAAGATSPSAPAGDPSAALQAALAQVGLSVPPAQADHAARRFCADARQGNVLDSAIATMSPTSPSWTRQRIITLIEAGQYRPRTASRGRGCGVHVGRR